MTGKMTGLKKGIHLVVFLPQLFQEREKEREIEKVRKRKHLGELRKIGRERERKGKEEEEESQRRGPVHVSQGLRV